MSEAHDGISDFRAKIADYSQQTSIETLDALLEDMVRARYDTGSPGEVELKALFEQIRDAKVPGADLHTLRTQWKDIQARLFDASVFDPPLGADDEGLARCYYRRDGLIYRQALPGGKTTPLISTDLRATGRFCDPADRSWHYLIEAPKPDGSRKTILVPESLLAADPKETVKRLTFDLGVTMHAATPDMLCKAIYPVPSLPLGRIATRLGWQDDSTFALPDRVIGAKDDEPYLPPPGAVLKGYGCAGSLEGWREGVAAPLNGNVAWIAMMATKIGAPLIPFLPDTCPSNLLVHFHAPTTKGKTTGMQYAATVWGTPDPLLGMIEKWRVTDNALENLARDRQDFGLLLDEIKMVEPEKLAAALYTLAEGRKKGRGTRDGGSQPPASWRTLIVSTGEKSLREHAASSRFARDKNLDAGIDSRAIDIAMPEIGNLHGAPDARTFIDEILRAAYANHGHAGPAIVEWAIANGEKARAELARFWSEWQTMASQEMPDAATPQIRRIADRLGVFAILGGLAASVLYLPWRTRRSFRLPSATVAVFDAWLTILRARIADGGATELAGTTKLVDDLRTGIAANQHRFMRYEQSARFEGYSGAGEAIPVDVPKQELFGYCYTDDVGGKVKTTRIKLLRPFFAHLGWDDALIRQTMSHLKDAGMLRTNRDGNYQVNHRMGAITVGVWELGAAFFEGLDEIP